MLFKRIVLCLVVCLLAACAPTDQEMPQSEVAVSTPAVSPAPAIEPAPVAEAELAEAVQKYLEEHPEFVLQVIRENPQLVLKAFEPYADRVYGLVELGAEKRREMQLQTAWEIQAEDPFEPAIDFTRPRLGPAGAPITVVEYSDFECPYCSKASETINELLEAYPGLLSLYFKHFPLESHENSMIAAKYFEAAGLQDNDKAWALYQRFFNNQKKLSKEGEEWILGQAEELELDVERLKTDMDSEEVAARIEADTEEAKEFGARGTPYFLVGGVSMSGAMPLEDFEDLVEYLKEKRGLDKAGQEAENPGAPAEKAPAVNQGREPGKSGAKEDDEAVCIDCLSKEG